MPINHSEKQRYDVIKASEKEPETSEDVEP